MFELTRDEQLFRKIFEDEQTYPRYFQDGNNNWTVTWDNFKAFCDKCERIYTDGNGALVYVERIGANGNLHFSLLRGCSPDISALVALKNLLCTKYDMIFAWVGLHNRGLRKIVEQCGMVKTGLEMRFGTSHNRTLIWECYTIHKNSLKSA